MSIICMTCEQLSQCNLLSTVSLQSISCLYRFCLEKKRDARNEFGRKGETNIFCHGPHLTFLLNLRRIFTKNSPFLSNQQFSSESSPFSLLREFLYISRHFFWEYHIYVHMSYLPCPSICSELGPEGISIQLSTVLVSPRHVIP